MKRSIFGLKKAVLLALVAFSSACFAQVVHTVDKGETYYSISRKYGITVDQLQAANGLTKDSVLKAGQKLTIPGGETKESPAAQSPAATSSPAAATAPSSVDVSQSNANRKFDTYTVQKGDTFYHIAKVNEITVDELKALNNLDSDAVLKIGMKLKIPVTIVDTANPSLPSLPDDPRKYSAKKGDSSLTWPVKNPSVTYMTGKINGVQLSAQKNESVTAIRAGTIMYVGNYRGYGQVVFVQSKTGHIYVYSGLGSIKVKKGDYVVFGDAIGTAGVDSIKGTNQISLMVFQKSAPIDPAKAPRG